jgi:hypothetical protein
VIGSAATTPPGGTFSSMNAKRSSRFLKLEGA